MRVAEDGKELARFEYHNNNQLAKVVRENGIETFEWDGLALIERNGTKYINEPHVGGGNPVFACRRRNYRSDIYGYAWDKLRQDRRE